MSQLGTNIYATGAGSNIETMIESPLFPKAGKYQIQTIDRIASWLKVNASADNRKIYEFALIKLGFLDSTDATSIDATFHTKIAESVVNFSRLFEIGKSFTREARTEIDNLNEANLPPDLSFRIHSPADLLKANLRLMNWAEKMIFNGLFPSQPGKLSEAQRLRLTQTKFLHPLILSQMTDGGVSVEEAHLLIPCLGLAKNDKKIPICDPATGNFHEGFQANMLEEKARYRLLFLDPADRLNSLSKITYDPAKDCEDTELLFKETKIVVLAVLGILDTLLGEPSQSQLLKNLTDASVDHENVWSIINQLESYFPTEQKELVLERKEKIVEITRDAFNKFREIAKKLPSRLESALKNIESRARLTLAVQHEKHKSSLEIKFDKFEKQILAFVKLSSQKYEIENTVATQIKWIVQGVEILENVEISKTCAISRRVLYPTASETNRSDLVYFSSNDNEESVASLWKTLCDQHNLSDSKLADHLLSLYQGNENEELDKFKPFLPFLMVLLLGKEPAYDSSSFIANFILLFSVKLGIHTFQEALKKMPMVPQGAIASKQFLLHVSGQPLDALARVQYKDKKQVAESTLLSTAASFLGSASNWIQLYNDVATTAIKCSSKLLLQGLNSSNIDLNDPFIQELHNILDRVHHKVWQSFILDRLQDKSFFRVFKNKERFYEFYKTLKETFDKWDPATVFQNLNIDSSEIEKMNQAWDDHFVKFMSSCKNDEEFNDKKFDKLRKRTLRRYRMPIPYELPKVRLILEELISNEVVISNDDPLAKWAISYMTEKHPLKHLLNS